MRAGKADERVTSFFAENDTGFDEFLIKPVLPSDLAEIIESGH